MKRLGLALAFCLASGATFADVEMTGDLEKDYMRFYCVYESHLYSLGSDMCSADGNVQICTLDEKSSPRPVWKIETKPCQSDAGGE